MSFFKQVADDQDINFGTRHLNFTLYMNILSQIWTFKNLDTCTQSEEGLSKTPFGLPLHV